MRYGLVGDAHLGFKAYDTDKRTKEGLQVFEEAIDKLSDMPVICFAGDLFDDTSIPNWVKREIIRIKEKCPKQEWIICGGNHDSTKTYSSVSTLDVFGELNKVEVINNFYYTVVGVADINVLVIPHMRSQEQFLATIDELLTAPLHWDVCLMHCMVHSDLELGPNDLNIDMYRLEKLANQCEQIWIGHEHAPKIILPNVRIPGGTLEFDFGQLGSKYVYSVDNNVVTPIELNQPRKMEQISLLWSGPMDILSLHFSEDTIYKLVVSGIPPEEYSTARIAVDTVIDRFNGDIVYNLLKTGHKELVVSGIDAHFDLLQEFELFAATNQIKDAESMRARLEDAVSDILLEEEENL